MLETGHTVDIADNLCNSKAVTIDKIDNIQNIELILWRIDVTDKEAVDTVYPNQEIDSVIHFTDIKVRGESV